MTTIRPGSIIRVLPRALSSSGNYFLANRAITEEGGFLYVVTEIRDHEPMILTRSLTTGKEETEDKQYAFEWYESEYEVLTGQPDTHQ